MGRRTAGDVARLDTLPRETLVALLPCDDNAPAMRTGREGEVLATSAPPPHLPPAHFPGAGARSRRHDRRVRNLRIGKAINRGQAYCGNICRAAARVVSARAARMRHERSHEDRLDHRDRQRAYRMRLRARVTDHASPVVPLPSKMPPPRSEPTHRAPVRADLPTCSRCGCTSAWVGWVPFPGARIRARTWPRKGRTATVRRQARRTRLRDGTSRAAGAGLHQISADLRHR